MTSYESLYNRALAQITDPLLAQLPEEDLEIMLHDWLMDAIVEPVVGVYDFSDRDEELKQFNFDISEEKRVRSCPEKHDDIVKMGKKRKIIVAYLYLLHYQLEAKNKYQLLVFLNHNFQQWYSLY